MKNQGKRKITKILHSREIAYFFTSFLSQFLFYFYLFYFCLYVRVDPSVLSDSSLSLLIRRLTDISIRGLSSIWLPPKLPQPTTSSLDSDQKNVEKSSVEIQRFSDIEKKCPLRRAVLQLLSSLARTRKYDEIMKNDCLSVLISYASLGTFQ